MEDLINKRYIQARMNTPKEKKTKLLGYGTVIIENSLVIKNVRLYQGKKGAFISFPQRITDDHGYQSYVTCSEELAQEITQAVMLDLVYQEARYLLIEDIKIYPVTENKGLLAFAAVKLTMGLVISNIKIVAGKNGPSVIMPQYNGEDLVYPLGEQNRKAVNAAILEKYRGVVR